MNSRTALPAQPFRPAERALPAKTRLDEFEFEAALAQSSFSVVYRAYDHVLKMHVAIKEYLPDALALRSAETQVVVRARTHAERFEQGLQAFIAEAQTLARCEHPSLQRISRLLLRHGTAYRVMRYSPAPTLLAYRRDLGATPAAASVRTWLDALLGALEALHEEGCVHGAVTSGNILLLPNERPLLLDFDAVRSVLISDRTQSMMAALEPCYEAPEQREPTPEQATGPWTDLYALAATLHFCISGQLPPPPDGAARRFESLASVWPRVRLAQPGLGEAPPWLNALDACLREDPQARPQSVAELRGLLAAPGRASVRPAVVPVLEVERDAVWLSPPARPAVPVAPAGPTIPATMPLTAAASQPLAAAAAAPLTQKPAAPDPAHAKVLADLDKTFAFIAAQVAEDAEAAEDGTEGATEEAAPAAAVMPVNPAKAAAASRTESRAAQDGGTVKPLTRQQWLRAGGAALVMLVAMAAAVLWLIQQNPSGLLDAAPNATAPSGMASAKQATPTEDATAKALEAAAAALSTVPPRDAPADAAAAVSPKSPAKAARKPKAAGPTSPREACGERTRFSLYQCLQTQCAKPVWAKHAQCVQLRKDQKL